MLVRSQIRPPYICSVLLFPLSLPVRKKYAVTSRRGMPVVMLPASFGMLHALDARDCSIGSKETGTSIDILLLTTSTCLFVDVVTTATRGDVIVNRKSLMTPVVVAHFVSRARKREERVHALVRGERVCDVIPVPSHLSPTPPSLSPSFLANKLQLNDRVVYGGLPRRDYPWPGKDGRICCPGLRRYHHYIIPIDFYYVLVSTLNPDRKVRAINLMFVYCASYFYTHISTYICIVLMNAMKQTH